MCILLLQMTYFCSVKERASVKLIKDCLDNFSCTSGMSDVQSAEVVSIMGFQHGTLPVKYLGTPLHSRRLSTSDFQPLVSEIERVILGWSARTMSYAWRLQLINSVLQGVIGFWSQMYVLPRVVIHRIESLCRKFLWNGNANRQKAFGGFGGLEHCFSS